METRIKQVAGLIILIFLLSGISIGQESSNTTLVGRWANGRCNTVDVYRNIVCIGNGGYLEIFDASYPDKPFKLGKIILPGVVISIDIFNTYAYVLYKCGPQGETGFKIIDISDPANPIQIGFFDVGKYTNDLEVCGIYAYINGNHGMQIIDISDPSNPFKVGFIDTGGRGIEVRDTLAYFADYTQGLRVINISDPANPKEIGIYNTPGSAYDVVVEGDIAYIADYNKGLRIIDISDSANPTEIGFLETDGKAYSVVIRGTIAYVAGIEAGMCIVDISEPSNPTRIANFKMNNSLDVSIISNYAYLANFDGWSVINISNPAEPIETITYYTGTYFNDVEVRGDKAYLASFTGLHILDISIPSDPINIGFFQTHGLGWGVDISENTAYFADGDQGLLIIDISDPTAPKEVGFFIDMDAGEFASAEDIVIRDTLAYLAYEDLRIINIANPAFPYEIGSCFTGGWTLEVDLSGDVAYVCDFEGGFRVIDISDPFNPAEIGFYELGISAWGVEIQGNYAYVAHGSYGLQIFDISDPTNPNQTGFLYLPRDYAYDIRINGSYAYIAHGENGLRMIDISDPANPVEAGYYDTGNNAQGITIDDDFIYVADGDDGLYIIRNDLMTGKNEIFKPYTESISLFPNPTNSILNISGLAELADVKIYSIQGQLLKSEHQVKDKVDISDLPLGIYILNIYSEEIAIKKKIIKK